MKMTLRWYGAESDSVTLRQLRQIPGVSGIMGVLDDKAPGEIWTREEIGAYIAQVHAVGLACEVIESVNVHEDIKLGLPTRDRYIENYCTTIRNLAEFGVHVIVYNFMPVFDWIRTDLNYIIEEDGSSCMYYDEAEIGSMGPVEIVKRTMGSSGGFTLSGWEPERLAELEQTMERYRDLSLEDYRENYRYFLNGIIPVCEQCGVTMAVHPDDPSWPIFDLPRTVYDRESINRILALHPSVFHSLCLCTGSLGANPDNDIPALIREYGAIGKIGCLHVRNLKRLGPRRFREAAHLTEAGDLDMYEIMRAIREFCPDTWIRPDHGRMIWDEQARPGYGLYDRAIGAAYLNGLWEAILRGSEPQ